jgi:hypothetical protein
MARTRPGLWFLALAVTAPALTVGSPALIALGTGIIALAFVTDDLQAINRGGVSAMTVYALSAAVIGFANAFGLSTAGTARESTYYLYVIPEHVRLAMMLALAGTVIPVVAFRFARREPTVRMLYEWWPRIRATISPRWLVLSGGSIALAAMLIRSFAQLPGLGTVTGIIVMLPQLIVFVLARAATEYGIRSALRVAMVLAILDAVYAAFFGFLRADIMAPFGAVTLGAVFGARSIRVLKRKEFLPVWAGAALFVVYFGAFAAARSQGGGAARIVTAYEMAERAERGEVAPTAARQTVLSRLTTFNQLSQIGRVVNEDGFLGGSTLEYLGFAFIPRFLWPEKPKIAKGAWWALRIGQANVWPDGTISNSVNMTIPGELYLNFGWVGVVGGCALFGILIAALWSRAYFWDGARNVTGSAFGFYLLWIWIALSLGPDLQVIVTMIAMYLVLVAAGFALRLTGTDAPALRRVDGRGGAGVPRQGHVPRV